MHHTLKSTARIAAFVLLVGPVPILAQQKPPEPPPLPIKAAPVTRATLNVEVTAVGTLRADETVMIRPEIAGRVAIIHFKEGQTVSAGDPLLTHELDPRKNKTGDHWHVSVYGLPTTFCYGWKVTGPTIPDSAAPATLAQSPSATHRR